MQKVVLVGYMGSGKSFIGQILSENTHFLFMDLDNIIEQNQNCSVKTIFETKGEIYFRKLEHNLFKEIIHKNQNFVLSTGGGTVCFANNHELLESNDVISIYLYASIDTLYDRLVHEKEKRPLLAHKTEPEMKEFIAKHLFERSFFYNQCQFKINVNNKSAHEIVSEILEILA
ncbi:MAG: shikimate kinase [Flavobacterium sp.]|nr:shikimate kinase [Flavobacterium sp.]